MITIVINGIFYMFDYNQHEYHGISATKISQNAFGLLIDKINATLYLMAFIVSYIVYSLNGYDLIRLADSSIFMAMYPDNWKHRIISVALILMAIVDSIIMFYCFGEWIGSFDTIQISIINLLKFYISMMIFLIEILSRLVFYYFKNTIRRSLQRIEWQLKSNEINEEESISTIRLLAYISMKFHSKAGYLAIIFVIEWTFYLLYNLLTIHMNAASIIQLVIVIFNGSFICYWLLMDYESQQTLLNIINHLRYRNDRRQQNFKIQSARSMDHLLALLDRQRKNSMDTDQLWPLFDQIGAIWIMKTSPKSCNQIRYFEMIHLYQEYFRMNLYDLFVYDQRFLFSMILFANCYFILIIQTEI